ncbi:MAG: hypothetical protein HOP95_12805 [Sphingomonas sp.]|nr:hypothetical protein [Sphingomonas sp.]
MALKEAYGAKLASIAYAANVTFEGLEVHPPDPILSLISELQSRRWYWAPASDNEHYAGRYLDYLEAAILGDLARRTDIARDLMEAPADRFFKKVLVIT